MITLYRMLYNEGVQCWLGGEGIKLEDTPSWLLPNLENGSTVTFEPYQVSSEEYARLYERKSG